MKKNNLIVGFIYSVCGLLCLFMALIIETRLEALLWGFTGALLVPGIIMICQYYYWNSPKNRERYQKRLENEQIEMNDELKIKIRDKAGRYAYNLGLVVTVLFMVIFSVLGTLEYINNAYIIVLYLGAYLVFQIVTGIVIFNYLMKRY